MKAMGKRSIASFLRGWLTLAWWLVWVSGALVVAVFAVALITGGQAVELLGVPVDFELDSAAYSISTQGPSPVSATIDAANGTLQFGGVDRWAMAVYLCIVIVYAAVLLFVIRHLRLVFRSLADGNPFSPENASRIRSIGLIFIFGEVAESLLALACQLYVKSTFVATGLKIKSALDLELWPIFAGFVLLVIAEVFRLGTQLQEDRDLTV
jgi:hypothetical protein